MTATGPHCPPSPDLRSFACFVLDGAGRVLLVRHAWPALWSHAARRPRPSRRADGPGGRPARPRGPRPHPGRRRCASGRAPRAERSVYLAAVTGRRDPDPARVLAHRWVGPEELGRAVVAAPWALSPLLVELVRALGDVDEPADLSMGLVG